MITFALREVVPEKPAEQSPRKEVKRRHPRSV
jgi:hypothetical protein